MECEGGVCWPGRQRAPETYQTGLWAYDVSNDSIAVRWPKDASAVAYELQFRASSAEEWLTASSTLKACTARKSKLQPATTYLFRVRSRDRVGWGSFSSDALEATTLEASVVRPLAPTLKDAGGVDLVVEWPAVPAADRYELQFASDGGEWATASAKLRGTSARKKSLVPGCAFDARVRALVDGRWSAFSLPSAPMSAAALADCWPRNLGPTLTNAAGELVPTQALAGGLVFLFAAASW